MHRKSAPISLVSIIYVILFLTPRIFADYLPIASYKMDVKLDDKKKIVAGRERITFLNTSDRKIGILYLHLYANAFSSDSTIFVKESRYLKEQMKIVENQGNIKVKTVKISAQDVSFHVDETRMWVALPELLKPGRSVELSVEFELKLPKIVFRMGYDRNNFLLCEWFPKMAVLEKDGTWKAFPYHYFTEYFSDFGTYDVSITLPLKYIIDGTGEMTSDDKNPDSTRTVTFHAEKVHDFAWVASPDFKVKKAKIEGIDVVFLFLPGDLYKFPKWRKAAEMALGYCDSHFGRYPYDKLVIADARIGLGSGAMESPMFITMPPELPFLPENIRFDEWVMFHELAHQWWYGIVASNEAEEAWLDEGMATYTTRKIVENEYGKKGNLIDLWGLNISDQDFTRMSYSGSPKLDPIVKPAWEFVNVVSYSDNVYMKASLVLDLLENLAGKEKMERFLKEYYGQYQFKHPKTEDFKKLAEEITGQNLDGFFKDWFYDTKTCDYQISRIRSEQKGDFKKGKLYETTVELRRNGDITMPVDVVIELENGEKIAKTWDGKDKWYKLKLDTKSRIKSAVLDPENRNALDLNVNNNGLSNKPYRWPVFKFFSDYLFWMETLVQWMVDSF